jgi:hypothetical protein
VTFTIGVPTTRTSGRGAPSTSADRQKAFTEPGRYLVISNIRPHYVEFKMYGWVNVE